MVDLSILKNPLVVGILGAALTYLYIWWEEKKRREKNPKAKERPINVITPAVGGIIGWFIASNYFNNTNNVPVMPDIKREVQTAIPQIVGGNKHVIVNNNGGIDSEGSLGSASYHIISKNNVRLPPTDVFIDLAKF